MKAILIASLCQILSNPSYQPPPCVNDVCVLTGLGGIVSQWEMHVDKHHGALFIVSGTCASACLIAVTRALQNGERVEIVRGAKLIPHDPSPAEAP